MSYRRGVRTVVACAALVVLGVGLSDCSIAAPEESIDGASIGQLPEPASAWPQAQFDARHSSGTTSIGPQTGAHRWTSHLGGNVTPGPVVEVDGSVVVASNSGVLYDLDPVTGAVRWKVDGGAAYGSDLSTSPAILPGGEILWPGPGSTLFAVSATGHVLWRERMSGQVLSPALAGDHRVYVADSDGELTAIVVKGTRHHRTWTITVGAGVYASPSVGPDGTIYTATSHALVAVQDHGSRATVRWRFDTQRQIEVSSGVSRTGIVVLGTNNGGEFGVRPDGSKAWSIPIGDYTYSSSTVAANGLAYFADNSGRVRTVDWRTGRVVRVIQPLAPAREHAWTSVLVDRRGDTYWSTETGHVYGYSATGAELFRLDVGAGVASYPALDANGTLYFGTEDGRLLALGDNTP